MNDEEMTWDAWLWVALIALFSVGLVIAGISLFGLALGATA
ncbi:hypothetical protein ACTXM3_11890 [Glutamicibacter arilaitensis]